MKCLSTARLFVLPSVLLLSTIPLGTSAQAREKATNATVGVTVTGRRLGSPDTLPGGEISPGPANTERVYAKIGPPTPLPMPESLAPVLPDGPQTFAQFLASVPAHLVASQSDAQFRLALKAEIEQAVRRERRGNLPPRKETEEPEAEALLVTTQGYLTPSHVAAALESAPGDDRLRAFFTESKGEVFLAEAIHPAAGAGPRYLVGVAAAGGFHVMPLSDTWNHAVTGARLSDLTQSQWMQSLEG